MRRPPPTPPRTSEGVTKVTDDGPHSARRWRPWAEVAELFQLPDDSDLPLDRNRLVDGVRDPWSRTAQTGERAGES